MPLELEDEAGVVDDEGAAGVDDVAAAGGEVAAEWEADELLELPPQAATPSAATTSSSAHARADRVLIAFMITPVLPLPSRD